MTDIATLIAAGFKGPARRLTDDDIGLVAKRLGCDPLHLRAVIAVETSGSGFDHAGRPTMLFEPHVFYRQLTTRSASALTAAIEQKLAYPYWGSLPYPNDSYPRLIAACALDPVAALKSASWGIGQVMGENCQTVGYASPLDMVAAAMEGECEQLTMMSAFIRANNLATPLAQGDWAAFARGYNGAGYATNHYDTRLAAFVEANRPAATSVASVPAAPPADTSTSADDLMAAELAQLDVSPMAPVPEAPAADPTPNT